MAMEYDSDISCEDRLRALELSEECIKHHLTCHSENSSKKSWSSFEAVHQETQPRTTPGLVNRALSTQVMEYYHQYRNSNIEQYFSLPTTSTSSDYNHTIPSKPDSADEKLDIRDHNCSYNSYVDKKERRRWARPSVVGQCLNVEPPTSTNPRNSNLGGKSQTFDSEKKSLSPTLSSTSHRPLEWDSGADVGYFNITTFSKRIECKLSTIERMALARGCSAALRLDPEGTTEPGLSGPSNTTSSRSQMRPEASSTPLPGNISGSESEIEITPVAKTLLPGEFDKVDENPDISEREEPAKPEVFKVPCTSFVKYPTEKTRKTRPVEPGELKKSSSMNLLPHSRDELYGKRSQSELNLCAKEIARVPPKAKVDSHSSSSITTVVNKIVTCDKLIQTSITSCSRESVGVQVEVSSEEKPPLPKRGTSLGPKSLHSILKNSKSAVMVRAEGKEEKKRDLGNRSSSTTTMYESTGSTPQPEDAENVTGRANSFEYFPGHVYETVPNELPSRASSMNTIRSNSTMPNTSSSIDEKLWGDSDSLVRDLERSVSILKSLVDANKCDKQVKKRLIHHVVKRLVSVKYTDDKIERHLEDNVPWNPDDARKKVYRAEIIHALTKKQNTTDSSEDWKPQRKKNATNKSNESEARAVKEIINLESSSDKFDRNTDRTEMDGRKARMGLRSDHCGNSSNSPSDANKSESSECFMPQRAKMKGDFCLKKKCRGHLLTNSTPSDENRVLMGNMANGRESPVGFDERREWKLPVGMEGSQYEVRRCSNTDSVDMKLVSYAEMERKNQLVWINDVINHLSSLKSRLEQPKELERSKSSPRKSRQSSYKTESTTIHTRVINENGHSRKTERDTIETPNFPITKHWSSHCNLVSYNRPTSPKTARPTKKRNSYTQTGAKIEESHSKNGAEVVSASRLHGTSAKSTNIHVQTSPLRSSPPSRSLQRSPNSLHHSCACHQNCKHQMEQSYQRTYHRHSRIHLHYSTTQNLEGPKSPECSGYADERPIITQSILPSWDNKKETKNHLNSSKLEKWPSKVKDCELCAANERFCDCKNCGDHESERRHRRKESGDCRQSSFSKSYDWMRSPGDERAKESHQCCRDCGVAFQRGRKCNCLAASHPKAVAYELSFTSGKGTNRETRFSESRKAPEARFCKGREEVCSCNGERGKSKDTLQDYLVSNKPTFINNIETRRQYIFEISQLRQLRKEKRFQLLAMSNTSNSATSPKLMRKTKCVQKKITEEDTKKRVRQRYFRLDEVRAKRRQKKKDEELRRNRLMAQIFGKKLQQKVLRGQVDLSQSVSVISNL